MVEKDNAEATKKVSAYTPGLKVKRDFDVIKDRRLPIKGETLVKLGEKVDFDTEVAKCKVIGDSYLLDASDLLDIDKEDVANFLIKKIGDNVKKGEIIARKTGFFGLINKVVESPVDGTLERVSDLTGKITIQQLPIPVEVTAFIPGKVINVIHGEGVEIETHAAFIQGVIGVGGETHGKLIMLANSPDMILTPELITSEHKGKILVGGSFAEIDSINKAKEVGVTGIIIGGLNYETLVDILGHELGVAITGNEDIELTLMITEGFGKMIMSQRIFNLCREFEGYEAAINGKTQIRAGVIRPELIIPHNKPLETNIEGPKELDVSMTYGTSVRIIREPYFGKIGVVTNLPVELNLLESESKVRVVTVQLENEGEITIPRANVEIIEE